MSLIRRISIALGGARVIGASRLAGRYGLVLSGELRAMQYVRPLLSREEDAVYNDLRRLGYSHWKVRRYLRWRRRHAGQRVPLGILARQVITNAGVAFLVDDWDASVTDITNMNFHASGTGIAAEAVGDTALGTEVETRDAGTRSQPTANQYRTVATHTYGATFAITEHGIFSQLALGGTLWDRSVFAAINVVSGDSIQFTYTCTVSAGG